MPLPPRINVNVRVCDDYEGVTPAFVVIEVKTLAEGHILERIEVYPLTANLRQSFASEVQRVMCTAGKHFGQLIGEYKETTQVFIQGGYELDDVERKLTVKCARFLDP